MIAHYSIGLFVGAFLVVVQFKISGMQWSFPIIEIVPMPYNTQSTSLLHKTKLSSKPSILLSFLGLNCFLMHTSITIMVRPYHISQLQGSGLGYLEYLRMEWFRHSSMLGHYHLQVGIFIFCTIQMGGFIVYIMQ